MNRRFFQLVFTSSVIILVIVTYLAYVIFREFETTGQWVEHAEKVKTEVEHVISSSKDLALKVREMALLEGSIDKQFLDVTEKDIWNQSHVLDSLIIDDTYQQKNADLLLELLTQQKGATHSLIDLLSEKNYQIDSLKALLAREAKVMNAIRTTGDNMITEENKSLTTRRAEQEYSGGWTALSLLILVLLALAITSYLFVNVFRLLKKNHETSEILKTKVIGLNREIERRQDVESLLRSVLDSSPNGIMTLGAIRNAANAIVDFRYIMVNYPAVGILRKSERQITGSTLLQLMPDSRRPDLFDAYVRVVETGESIRQEKSYSHDGFKTWFDITVTKRGDGLVVTFSDITIQKIHEIELLDKTEALERSNHELEQFAYIASHDLQEPLRKIRAFGDRLTSSYSEVLEDKGKDYISRMQNAAERMQILIDDLLRFSRISRAEPRDRQVDLNDVFQEVLNDLEVIISQKETTIEKEELPVVRGDHTQFRQLFQNLLTNAIKYSHPHIPPFIRVTSQLTSCPEALANKRVEKCWKIAVIDNGIGFDPQYKDQIFLIFQRSHGRTEYSGTGIGLAICQKIIDNHGGWIEADSTPGKGAVFTFYLPEVT